MYIFIRSQAKNQVIAEVEQQGEQIMSLMTQTLRNADAVNSPTKGNNASTISIDVFDAGELGDCSDNFIYIGIVEV